MRNTGDSDQDLCRGQGKSEVTLALGHREDLIWIGVSALAVCIQRYVPTKRFQTDADT